MAIKLVKTFFEKHPLAANSFVYGSLYVGAEFSQQILTKKLSNEKGDEKDAVDFKVLGRYFIVGSVINSNYLYAWYRWLDNKYVGTRRDIIIKKILLDQFVMTPPLYLIFYVSMSLMEGKKDPLEEFRQKFWRTFSVSCTFWLPAQIINFVYLPNRARIVYMGLCSFAWVNMLCWIKRKDVHT